MNHNHVMRAFKVMAPAALCALLAACGESTLGDPAPATLLWNDSSQGIDVSCFALFQGSMRFRATRDQLSAAQLEMLSSLKVVDSNKTCIADGMGCSLSVAQADGTTRTMDAVEMDDTCGESRKVVSFASFDPFRRSLACRYAKYPDSTVTVDERCFNGLFTSGQGESIAVSLQIDQVARTHHIELDECADAGRLGKLSFSLLDSDGLTVLGTSSVPTDPGANGTCAALVQTFSHTGLFSLQIATEPGLTPAGDLYLRVY